MFARRIPLIKLLGFQVWVDWSWLVLALLIAWSLATGLFPLLYADQVGSGEYWIMGFAGAAGLFVSIVGHELGHALVARRFGMEMRGITLFVFGGVAEMSDEPPSARAEFFMAVAGPIVSVIIGCAMLLVSMAGVALSWPIAVLGVVGWLGWINLILVAFNIIPAFPLDGGRVLRAVLWEWKDDLRWATRIASHIGSGFGIVLIFLGVFSLFTGNFVGGVWWFLLGLFLHGAARMSHQQVIMRRELEGEPVERFMQHNPITVSPGVSVRRLVDGLVYRHQFKMYPVVEGDQLIGCVTLADIRRAPREEWDVIKVEDIMTPCTEENTIDPHADATEALSKLKRTGTSRLVVADHGHLDGVVALKDLLGFLAMKIDLEGAA